MNNSVFQTKVWNCKQSLRTSDASDYTFLWSNGKSTQIIEEIGALEDGYIVEVIRQDGCQGIDSIFQVGPPDIAVEYTDSSLCFAVVRIENTIPQSILCHDKEVPDEDCWWSEVDNAYYCEITLLQPSDEFAQVVVIDDKGCEDSIEITNCVPHISRVKPNPSPGLFTVELEGIPINTPLMYRVYSSDGRLVKKSDDLESDDLGSSNSASGNWRSIDINLDNGFLSGMYIVRFEIGESPIYLFTKLIKIATD